MAHSLLLHLRGLRSCPVSPSTNGHRKWPRCVRSSFGLRPRRECWLNFVEKCGLGPRVVVIVGLAHVLSGQFAFRQLVSSARGRCVEERIIGASTLSAAKVGRLSRELDRPLTPRLSALDQPFSRPGSGAPSRNASYASRMSSSTVGWTPLYRTSRPSRCGPDTQNFSPVSTS
jgi:hypothetical protein